MSQHFKDQRSGVFGLKLAENTLFASFWQSLEVKLEL